jgi:hypothetical protein
VKNKQLLLALKMDSSFSLLMDESGENEGSELRRVWERQKWKKISSGGIMKSYNLQ